MTPLAKSDCPYCKRPMHHNEEEKRWQCNNKECNKSGGQPHVINDPEKCYCRNCDTKREEKGQDPYGKSKSPAE